MVVAKLSSSSKIAVLFTLFLSRASSCLANRAHPYYRQHPIPPPRLHPQWQPSGTGFTPQGGWESPTAPAPNQIEANARPNYGRDSSEFPTDNLDYPNQPERNPPPEPERPQGPTSTEREDSIGDAYLNEISNIFHDDRSSYAPNTHPEPPPEDPEPEMARLPLVNIDNLYLPFFNDSPPKMSEGEEIANEIEQELDDNIQHYVENQKRQREHGQYSQPPQDQQRMLRPRNRKHDQNEEDEEPSEDDRVGTSYQNASNPRQRLVGRKVRPRSRGPGRPTRPSSQGEERSQGFENSNSFVPNPLKDDNIRVHVYGSYKRPPSGSHTSTLVPNYGPVPSSRSSSSSDEDQRQAPPSSNEPEENAPPPAQRNLTPSRPERPKRPTASAPTNPTKYRPERPQRPRTLAHPPTSFGSPFHTFPGVPATHAGLVLHQVPPSPRPLVIVPVSQIPGLTSTSLDESQEGRALLYGGGRHHHQNHYQPTDKKPAHSHPHYGYYQQGRANIKAYRGPSEKVKSGYGYGYFAPWGYSSYVPQDDKHKKKHYR